MGLGLTVREAQKLTSLVQSGRGAVSNFRRRFQERDSEYPKLGTAAAGPHGANLYSSR